MKNWVFRLFIHFPHSVYVTQKHVYLLREKMILKTREGDFSWKYTPLTLVFDVLIFLIKAQECEFFREFWGGKCHQKATVFIYLTLFTQKFIYDFCGKKDYQKSGGRKK